MECGDSTTTRRSAHHSAFRLVCNARSRGHGDPRLSQKAKPQSSTPNAGGGRNLGATKQHCGVGSTAYFDDCSTLITSLQIYGAPRGIGLGGISWSRRIPRCSTLHHHSPKSQETSSQCKTMVHGKADPTSSEHSTRIPVIDVGGEPDGHFVQLCFPCGASFHRPLTRRSETGRDGTGASLASSAAVFWLPFLLSGSAWFS